MNQFHTPSFGDEVFELNDTPAESPSQASRRMLSLDHSTLNDDDDEDEYDTYGGGHSLATQQQQQHHQQQQHQQQELMISQQQTLAQAPPKPLAPFALFFRDTVTAIKQQNPACSLEQMQVIVQTMWESLDETQKSVYSQRHEQDKRDYMRLIRDYRQQLSESEATLEPEAPQAAVAAVVPKVEVCKTEPTLVPKVEVFKTEPSLMEPTQQPAPEQIQLLSEAARVQKCTREQCNKPAIINPDWEDEYCSNECVVIHCRNVFNEWALSLKIPPF